MSAERELEGLPFVALLWIWRMAVWFAAAPSRKLRGASTLWPCLAEAQLSTWWCPLRLQAANVPKLFRHSGRIRNKHLSKRDTEKLVKEMWKERMNDPGGLTGWRWAQAHGHGSDSGAARTTRLGCAPSAGQLTMPAPSSAIPVAAAAAGCAVDLLEFVFQQLQKKVGIVTAVVEVRPPVRG